MQTIDPTAVAAIEGAYILDVREQDEYDAAHAPGVTLVPLGELMQRVDEVPTDRPVYVMCHSGGRSARATQYLEQQGVDAINIDGGITAWHGAGLPVEAGR